MPVGVPDVPTPVVEAWNPYPQMFSVLWNGRRHVMMGATQIDRYGNQNIACIGDWHKPKAQLLGFRGAPGNTINHTTTLLGPEPLARRCSSTQVDVVCGVGYDRAAALGPVASRFHEIRRVVTNLGVFDFETPDHRMRLRSVHPGRHRRRGRRGHRLRAGRSPTTSTETPAADRRGAAAHPRGHRPRTTCARPRCEG